MRLDRLFQKRTTPQEVAKQESIPPEEFVRYYEQAGQPSPERAILERLASGELNTQHLFSHLRNIESARNFQRTISQQELTELTRYGIKDLSETRINAQVLSRELLDLTAANLQEADLRKSIFNGVNFTRTVMKDVVLDDTVFNQSLLYGAEMPSIVLDGTRIDLEAGSTTVAADDTWNVHKSEISILDNCTNCEVFNEGVLNISSNTDNGKYSHRGILLFQEGKPLGMLKLKGVNTFLAMRTVRDTEGTVIFWKGMVYAFEKDVSRYLTQASLKVEDSEEWRRADTENLIGQKSEWGRVMTGLGRNNIRFIQRSKIFNRLDELTGDIEAGKEHMIDIFE